MIALMALRNIALRPWRSAFLLLGYSLGVAVMIVLLSIGEALLVQARDEKLVGGGTITVLPEGIDVEVMKTGGLGGLFFSIGQARFIYRQLLMSPRLAPSVTAAAPQIEDKLLYLRTPDREIPVMAAGEIPSRTMAVGAAPSIVEGGTWADDGLDRRWREPSDAELRHDIDHFHLPPAVARHDPTWGEWHYFNVLSPDRRKWAFISFIVGGEFPEGQWAGQVLVTLHEQGGQERRFATVVPASAVRLSTTRADLSFGTSSVTVLADGRYAVRARATEEGGRDVAEVDLTVTPTPGMYFPGAELLGGESVSGYVVPALRADATGRVCVRGVCDEYARAQSYHDHNWGVWSGVTWDWGTTHAGSYTLLYGRIRPADTTLAPQPLFAALFDSLGYVGLFRPRDIEYDDSRVVHIGGRELHVPGRAVMTAVRGADTLRVELEIEDASATARLYPRVLTEKYFVQMKGVGRLSGRVRGAVVKGEGPGFFETYR